MFLLLLELLWSFIAVINNNLMKKRASFINMSQIIYVTFIAAIYQIW